jgi:uracil-DNA glycosylase
VWQDKGKSISRAKHRVFMCAHPSPLSAHKTATPFMGSKSFSRVNDALKAMGKPPIDWNL